MGTFLIMSMIYMAGHIFEIVNDYIFKIFNDYYRWHILILSMVIDGSTEIKKYNSSPLQTKMCFFNGRKCILNGPHFESLRKVQTNFKTIFITFLFTFSELPSTSPSFVLFVYVDNANSLIMFSAITSKVLPLFSKKRLMLKIKKHFHCSIRSNCWIQLSKRLKGLKSVYIF